MTLSKEIQEFLLDDALKRFLKYAKVWTTADRDSQSFPSTQGQLELGRILVEELRELNLEDVVQDQFGYVYARLPANKGYEKSQTIGFIAHIDTATATSGKNVKPVIHKNYDGKDIEFTQNKDLILSISDSPQLEEYIGLDIITSEGDTLLGADNKAGIAEIISACAALQKYPNLHHGEIVVCFFPDEEIGKGPSKIDLNKLPKYCYTMDGTEMGELEFECFDAWKLEAKFTGLAIHPGYAKNKMINAISIASRFFSELPEAETPEHTEDREGYYYLTKMQGTVEEASARMLIRDFDTNINQKRMGIISKLKDQYESQYPGIKIELNFEHQYPNMLEYLKSEKKIISIAEKSIELAGLEVKVRSARGGTDGAQLCAKGIPTPNIFAGGLLVHSRKEYIPTLALQKAGEVILYLAELWAKEN